MTIYRNSSVAKLTALGETLSRDGHTSTMTTSEQWDEVPYVTTTARNRDIMHALRRIAVTP